jgi:hypothetical protein
MGGLYYHIICHFGAWLPGLLGWVYSDIAQRNPAAVSHQPPAVHASRLHSRRRRMGNYRYGFRSPLFAQHMLSPRYDGECKVWTMWGLLCRARATMRASVSSHQVGHKTCHFETLKRGHCRKNPVQEGRKIKEGRPNLNACIFHVHLPLCFSSSPLH